MILLVDRGNTRTKWRLMHEDASILAEGVDDGISLANLQQAHGNLRASYAINLILFASVADESTQLELLDGIAQISSAKCIRVAVKQGFLGLTLAYSDVSTLGVDRWLQLLVAYKQSVFPALVISAGTAITADKLDCSGNHIGGQIAPGIQLLYGALRKNTAIPLLERQLEGSGGELGESTERCIQQGVVAMARAYIEKLAEKYGRDCHAVWMSGGDAAVFSALSSASHKPNLVLDGLAVLFENLTEYERFVTAE